MRLAFDSMQEFGHPGLTALVRAAFARGDLMAYPTETFYGLGVDPRNAGAIVRLFAVKGRQPDEPLPLIAGSLDHVERVCAPLTDAAYRLAEEFWPGPLTLVLPIAPGAFPDVLTGGRPNIAVRVPGHEAAIALATEVGGLLTSTSANRSGEPPASTAEQVMDALGGDLDLILDAGPTPGGAPSTIVDLTTDVPRLVRAGSVPWDRVLKSLQQ